MLALVLGVLFLGIAALGRSIGAIPSDQANVLAQIGQAEVPSTPLYYTVQLSAAVILCLAANTSFNGFPRLAAVMAHDHYFPHQFSHRGLRLAYSNGILAIGIAAMFLVVAFGGSTHALIPLFAVGVFLCFTLSQAGMVVHWRRERSRGWRVKLAINGLGAITTGVVTLVVAGTKFVDGAWIVVLLVPFLVANFWAMHRHYMIALRQLAVIPPRRPVVRERVLIPVRGLNRAVAEAVQYALSITDPDRITAVHVVVEGEEDKGDKEELERAWHEWVPEVALHCVSSPYREVIAPVLHVIDDLLEKSDVPVTVLLPEVLPHAWYEEPLHNQLAIAFKLALLYKPGVVVTSVPVRLTE